MAYKAQILNPAAGGTGQATLTAHGVLLGNTTSAINSTAAGSAGQVLVSGGATADPAYVTPTSSGSSLTVTANATTINYDISAPVSVANGGTGDTSFSNTSALICSGTSSTGAFQNIASVASGQILTSAGTSTIPAWSGTPSVTSISFDSGTNNLANYAVGTFTPTITNSGSAPTLTYTQQTGRYTRIGNRYFCTIDVVLATYTAGSGNTRIASLPFTSNTNAAPNGPVLLQNVTFGASVLWYTVNPNSNATDCGILGARSAAADLPLVAAGPGSTGSFLTTLVIEI